MAPQPHRASTDRQPAARAHACHRRRLVASHGGRRHGSRAALLLVSALGVPAGAAAAEFRLTLDGALGARTDDNYQQTAGAADDARRELGTAALTLRVEAIRPRLELALTYEPSFQQLLEDSGPDATQHSFAAGLVGQLGPRTSLTVAERFRQGEELDLRFVVAPEAVTLTPRGERRDQAFDLGVRHEMSRRWSWHGQVTQRSVRYEEAAVTGGDAAGLTTGFSRMVGRDGEVGLELGAHRSDFDERGRADTVEGALSASFRVGRTSRLTADAGGWRAERPGRDGERVTESGPRGGLALAGAARRIGWRAEARRDIGSGIALGALTESDRFLLGVSVASGRWLTVAATGVHTRDRALGDEGADQREELEILGGTLELGFHFGPRVGLSLGAAWLEQTSSFTGFEDVDLTRYHAGLRVRLLSRGDPDLPRSELARGAWEPPAPTLAPAAATSEENR